VLLHVNSRLQCMRVAGCVGDSSLTSLVEQHDSSSKTGPHKGKCNTERRIKQVRMHKNAASM
jgi:hypothetical protein